MRVKLGGQIIAVAVVLFSIAACSIGPATIARDRFDYVSAISESWKRQMLLNLIKLRYGDLPVFLDVASVINQYSIESQIDLRITWNDLITGDSQALGGSGRYADRPTITYQPLMGRKFTQSLMTPIRPGSLFALIQAGWPVDSLLRLCIQSINGIKNRFGGTARARQADPEFYPMLNSLWKIQKSGAIGIRLEQVNKKFIAVIFFQRDDITEVADEIRFVEKILKIKTDGQGYRLVYGAFPKDEEEIAVLSRSIMEILVELASYIEVPQQHVVGKRVMAFDSSSLDSAASVKPMIQIKSAPDKPGDEFVSVKYRDHWFYIDDGDYPSKRIFTFLMFLISLTEAGEGREAPVITIPAG